MLLIKEAHNTVVLTINLFRNMLIRTHLQDLKDVTNLVHYENFRCRKLAGEWATQLTSVAEP